MSKRTLGGFAALCFATLPSVSHAGGFYLLDRGVRPLGRGGAFVAGADDAHAIWYNPAGLVDAGNGLLLDASMVLFSNTYTRNVQYDAQSASVRLAPTEGSSAPIPVPTLVFTHDFGLRNFRRIRRSQRSTRPRMRRNGIPC
jgi:long-chain fatty acid transport protein